MGGVRTPIRQFASCVLVDIDDTLDSIFSSDILHRSLCRTKGGIGINAGRIRGINSKIRGGEVQHTGVVPFLKKFESTVRCCTQNGIRGGSATVHFPIWHQEIEDILVLKTTKERRTIVSENLTTQSKSQNSSMKGLSKIRKSRFFLPIVVLTCLRVLGPLTLMSYIAVTNWMNQSPSEQVRAKN